MVRSSINALGAAVILLVAIGLVSIYLGKHRGAPPQTPPADQADAPSGGGISY